MQSFLFRLGAPFLFAALAHGAAALDTVAEVEACMKGNLPEHSSIQQIRMRQKDRVGSITELIAKIYWQKDDAGFSNVMMYFDGPPDLRGTAVLVLQKPERNDLFVYVPELGKTRRITKQSMQGSMFGTDFTYEDFERMQNMAKTMKSEMKPPAELDGRAVYVVESLPADTSQSEYERTVAFIDQETCAILRTESFDRGGELRKVMESPFAKVKQEPSGWIPREITIRDLVEETETTIFVDELVTEAKINRKVFSEAELARVGR